MPEANTLPRPAAPAIIPLPFAHKYYCQGAWAEVKSRLMLARLIRDEEGQDLVEYTLLVAFVVVVSAALIYNSSESMAGIANKTTNNLDTASSIARAGA